MPVFEYPPEIAEEVIERIACGETVQVICEDEHMPARMTVMRWIAKDETFRERYVTATRARAEAMQEQILEIADDENLDPARARVMIDTRKWSMGRISPKKWGDKVATEVSGPGGGPVETRDITDRDRAKALASLFARLKSKGEA